MNSLNQAKEIINDFIKKINNRTNTRKDNLLRLTIAEWIAYIDFLQNILEEYKIISDLCYKNFKKRQSLMKGKTGSWAMTEEEIKLSDESRVLLLKLRLQIESFYLFAHVLLTKITNFPNRYFTHPNLREIICGSHEQFWKSIEKSNIFKPLPKDLIDSSKWLTKKIIYYRDKIITHTLSNDHFKRMLIRGYAYGPDGSLKITSNTLYPKENDNEQITTEKLEDLAFQINVYIKEYINFLILNEDKSILSKKQPLKP